jgi:prepilin-type N-terminal cleavage/methylation domain-containing protein
MSKRHSRHVAQSGMTLIEVVIVLALLAGLAGMTLTATGEMNDESRASRTRSRADMLRRAVLGDGDGAGRFLADMGRSPVLQSRSEGRVLSEFFECPHDTALGRTVTQTIADDFFGEPLTGLPASASLRCGWNGPYVLTAGPRLYDGFGRDWRVQLANDPTWKLPDDLDDADRGNRIVGMASWGRDDAPGETVWADRDDIIELDVPNSEASLTVTVLLRDNTEMGNDAWKPVTATDPWSVYPSWEANTSYSENQIIRSSADHTLYRCSVAGVSGSTEPTWNHSHIGEQTMDDGVTWMLTSNRSHYANRVRVALFVPYVPTQPDAANGVELVALVARMTDHTPDASISPDKRADMVAMPSAWSGRHSVTYTGLAPGPRKLLACAFIDDGGTRSNLWSSPLIDVVLRPGGNVLTVHLSEPLE